MPVVTRVHEFPRSPPSSAISPSEGISISTSTATPTGIGLKLASRCLLIVENRVLAVFPSVGRRRVALSEPATLAPLPRSPTRSPRLLPMGRRRTRRRTTIWDGVSESQFAQVLNIELAQITEACKFLDDRCSPSS